MSDDNLDSDIQHKIEQAKKSMTEQGRLYDELSNIEVLDHEGFYFEPQNDIQYRRLIKEIRKSGNGDE